MDITKKIERSCLAIGLLILLLVVVGASIIKGERVEPPKDSLTSKEIMWLMQNNEVTGYSYSRSDRENDYGSVVIERGNNKGILEPVINKKIARIVIDSSGLEDDMIYSLGTIVFEDGSTITDALFINEPSTLRWVAISIVKDGVNNLFTFYENGVDIYGNTQR